MNESMRDGLETACGTWSGTHFRVLRVAMLSLVIGIWSGPGAANAQRRLSVQDALALAMSQNPDLKAVRDDLSGVEAKLTSSRWKLLPQVSAELSLSRASQLGSERFGSGNNRYAFSLGLRQTLVDFSLYGSLAEAKASRRGAELDLLIARSELVRDVKKQFSSALVASQSLELAKMITERRKRNLDLVTLSFEGGRENAGSVELSRANMLEAQAQQQEAQNTFVLAEEKLRAVMGLEVGDKITLQGTVDFAPAPAEIDVVRLVRQSPDYLKSVYQEERGWAAVRTARGRLLPSLGLVASVGKSGDRFFPTDDDWSAGFTLSIPIGDGSSYYDLQAARASASAASYRKQASEQAIFNRLQEAYLSLKKTEDAVSVTQAFRQAAQTRAEITRKKYELGLVAFDEWDRIESDLILRENAFLRATLERLQAAAEWEYLTSGLGEI